MTRQEQLEFCKKCTKRKSDINRGIICSLTNEKADFEGTCKDFEGDPYFSTSSTYNNTDMSIQPEFQHLDDASLNTLKSHQDFYYAIIGGLLVSIISGVLWAMFTVATQVQIGYMAIGVGLLVGFAVRFFGAGIDMKFGILGATLSLLGCIMGNLFSQVGFYAQEASLPYFEVLTYLTPSVIVGVLMEAFSPIDLLFYGIAIAEGYKLSFRKISPLTLKELKEGKHNAMPSLAGLRMPLVVISVLLIGFTVFKIRKGVSGFRTYYYESGEKMSEGTLHHSKEEGKWTFWYENGNQQIVAHFHEGNPDSLWQWYNESGKLIKEGSYKSGLEHGIWINYFENGVKNDSGLYVNGRMEGDWKIWNETGTLMQEGNFTRDRQDGIWKFYHLNGALLSEGMMKEGISSGLWTTYFDNGELESRIIHESETKLIVQDVWDVSGKQWVKDGEGTYQSFSDKGVVLAKGEVKGGLRTGEWSIYYENGNKKELGVYEGEIFRLSKAWYPDGKIMVQDGNGNYESYYPDGDKLMESGKMLNGLRQGLWKAFYESNQALYREAVYAGGQVNGEIKYYYESGGLYSTGNMINDLQEGEWTWFFENGEVQSKVSFVNNKKEGTQTMWSEVGEKIKEEYYKNGELTEEKVL
nr:toxin-antitoxin system YwqK family antitoxin [uncultured Carboxylicivirga sp.]